MCSSAFPKLGPKHLCFAVLLATAHPAQAALYSLPSSVESALWDLGATLESFVSQSPDLGRYKLLPLRQPYTGAELQGSLSIQAGNLGGPAEAHALLGRVASREPTTSQTLPAGTSPEGSSASPESAAHSDERDSGALLLTGLGLMLLIARRRIASI